MTPEFSRSKDGRRVAVSTSEHDGQIIVEVSGKGVLNHRLFIPEDDFVWLVQVAGPAVVTSLRRDRPSAG